MSRPREPAPAKLFLSAIYNERGALEQCLAKLWQRFGPSDYSSRETRFDTTSYYNDEMGSPLLRMFMTFQGLVHPGELPEIKLFTNSVEDELAADGKRSVNLDPGLVSLDNLVLATGKQAPHRPYLGRGIYADLNLIFESGSFRPLPWTYPDYADPAVISFMNLVREAYKKDLRESNAALLIQPTMQSNSSPRP